MLLEQAGCDFVVMPAAESVEDRRRQGETASDYVMRLACQKAEDVAPQATSDRVVLACDTLAECDGRLLGKPRDRRHAGQMLRAMRGRVHYVYSGLCLLAPGGRRLVDFDRTTLQMDEMSDEQLEDYLDTGQWEGKAGAFGYQDGIDWVRIIQGSESNVVGLPMELLSRLLEEL